MMDEKRIVLIVSDQHMGGGAADPGDDHVQQNNQFRRFIEEQTATTAGRRGDLELFINGDLLEFAQVEPEVYQLGSPDFWCSEAESVRKLEAILAGHRDVFAAFKDFQKAGNRITVAAGNHDVDFYWQRVQARFSEVAGPVEFALGEETYTRFDGKLQIAHGHQLDPANAFQHWGDPILDAPDGKRLEMCPGTLFMVKFVNWLEKDYPFADNLKPVTALRHILMREKRFGLMAAAWVLLKFMSRHPRVSLAAAEDGQSNVAKALKERLEIDRQFAEDVARLYREVKDAPQVTAETVRVALKTDKDIYEFLYEMMPRISPDVWMPIFDAVGGMTLSVGGSATTLAIKKGSGVDKDYLRRIARKELDEPGGPQVIVLGHTHQPDEMRTESGGQYFNPGSWTRYVDYDLNRPLTLADLKREEDFPYELNYIRVERTSAGLDAQKICFERKSQEV